MDRDVGSVSVTTSAGIWVEDGGGMRLTRCHVFLIMLAKTRLA